MFYSAHWPKLWWVWAYKYQPIESLTQTWAILFKSHFTNEIFLKGNLSPKTSSDERREISSKYLRVSFQLKKTKPHFHEMGSILISIWTKKGLWTIISRTEIFYSPKNNLKLSMAVSVLKSLHVMNICGLRLWLFCCHHFQYQYQIRVMTWISFPF